MPKKGNQSKKGQYKHWFMIKLDPSIAKLLYYQVVIQNFKQLKDPDTREDPTINIGGLISGILTVALKEEAEEIESEYERIATKVTASGIQRAFSGDLIDSVRTATGSDIFDVGGGSGAGLQAALDELSQDPEESEAIRIISRRPSKIVPRTLRRPPSLRRGYDDLDSAIGGKPKKDGGAGGEGA